MIINDKSNVSQVVNTIDDLSLIHECYHCILGMKRNEKLTNINWFHSSDISLSILQIHIIDLLLSMEKSKYKQAKSLIEILEKISKKESDERADLINSGIISLINENYYQARNYFYKCLLKNPKDIFSFYTCHMIEFNNGMTGTMLETLSLVNKHWGINDEFYSYFKGIKAFILNENGYHDESYDSAASSLKINSFDIYAIHAICHYFYDKKLFHEGKEWMDERKDIWHNNYGMRIHLFWHYAMFLMEINEIDQALDIYHQIRHKNDRHGLEDLDATSLLFKMKFTHGRDDQYIQKHANLLFESWNNKDELGFYFFNDFHAALVFGINKRFDMIDFLIEKTEKSNPIGYYNTKINILESIRNYSQENYKNVVLLLQEPMNYQFMGGSRIQRSIINEIFNDAKLKLGIKNKFQNTLLLSEI
ncbi:hypothetical protein ACP179_13110 [Xenorhabdus stockiae]|uniref:hypothetical protein n=1 Tax=Xenorhabdus stockiae TaxID=351614 RepID=UPI003CF35BE6